VLLLESGNRYWEEPEAYQIAHGYSICENRWYSSQLSYCEATIRERCSDVDEIFLLDAMLQELPMSRVIDFIEQNKITNVVIFGTRFDSNRCSASTFSGNKKFARALRLRVPKIHLTCYSAHAYVNPSIYWREFDSVICGQPEDGVVDAINGDKMKEYYTTDLQKMPSPTWLGIDSSFCYSSELNWAHSEKGPFHRRLSFLPVVSARGCPYRCDFCTIFYAFGSNEEKQRVYFRDISKFKRDLTNAKEAGFESLYLMDDYSFVNEAHYQQICSVLKEIGLPWSCQTRINSLTDENLDMAQDAGCIEIGVGLESPSTKLLQNMDKKLEFESLDRMLRKATERKDLSILCFVITGYPGETKEDFELLKKYVKSFGEKIKGSGASICTPYPGTKLWVDYVKAGLIRKDDLRITTSMWVGGTLNTDTKTSEEVRARWLDFDLNVSKPSFMESIREEYPVVYERFMKFDWEKSKKVLEWCEE